MSNCMKKAKTPKKLGLIFLEVVAISIVSFFAAEIALIIYNRFNPSFVFYSNSDNRFRGNHSLMIGTSSFITDMYVKYGVK